MDSRERKDPHTHFYAPPIRDERSNYSMARRLRITRLTVRTRIIVFLLVAFGIVVLPYGMLHTFEEMENGKNGLTTVVEHPHDSPDKPEVVGAPPLTDASSSSSSSVSSTFLATSPVPSSSRPDLPERLLTPYVNPLIGTEGYGHGIVPFVSPSNNDNSIRRRDNPLWNGKTCS
jgi:hypothetical protein